MGAAELVRLITNLQLGAILASCLLCLVYFHRLNAAEKIIFYYLFFHLIINNTASLIALDRINNLANTHLLVLGEFIFISAFYRELFKEKAVVQRYYRVFLGIVCGLIMANTVFLEKISTFNTNAKVLVLFFIIFSATYFFLDRSQRLMELDVHEKVLRVINAAFLLYYSGSFFVYLFYKFTQNNKIFYSNNMLIFNVILYLIFTLLILGAIVMLVFHRKKSKNTLGTG